MIAPVVPAAVVAVAVVCMVAAVLVAYARVRALRPADRALLGTLRALALLLVLGCLLRPGLVIASAVPQRNVLAVVMDDSRSMRIRDVDAATRTAAVQQLFADTAPLSKTLADKFALRRFRFAATASPVAGAGALTANGTRSDLAQALADVRDDLNGMPLAGVVLVSDGADNGSGALDDALLALRARRVPVFTVGVGTERFARDVAIERVQAPRRTLAGASSLVEADVRLRGAGRTPVTVTVEADGRVVATEAARTEAARSGAAGDLTTLRFRLPPLPPGVHRLAVRASTLPDEIVTENNEWQTSLEVRAGPDRVLYLEGEPRPEFAFLRRAVANDSAVQVVGLMRSAERKFLRLGVRDSLDLLGGFPTSRDELFGYRAIILGSIEASFFTAEQLRMLADF
ncbi:MAG: VWA domain-containing protein, partial [Gemmatimonadota bacterium]|nr:VWA domain-containing protein [Gemmatimonadota bacterium]